MGKNLERADLEKLEKSQVIDIVMGLYVEVKAMKVELDKLIERFDSLKNGYKEIIESDSYKKLQERKVK